MGYRYSPPTTHPVYPSSHHPGYTSDSPARPVVRQRGAAARLNIGVGLKSVEQLTLGTQISDIRGMTELYNVLRAGNPNDHKSIPGTK